MNEVALMKRTCAKVAAACLLLAARLSVADVIVVDNTFDPSSSLQSTGTNNAIAQGFTMNGTPEALSTIAAAVEPGDPLALYTDSAAGPVALVTNLSYSGTNLLDGDPIYTPVIPTTLLAGQGYMVVLTGGNHNWSLTVGPTNNNLGSMTSQVDHDFWYNIGGGGWFQVTAGSRAQLQVNAQSPTSPAGVPEIDPGSAASALTLLGGGAAVLGGRRKRARRRS
jgi:hypothetical protein